MANSILEVEGYIAESIKSKFKDDGRYTIWFRLYALFPVALG